MKTFWVMFQEIHKRVIRKIAAPDMDAAKDKADAMLPKIIAEQRWLEDHAFVALISINEIPR